MAESRGEAKGQRPALTAKPMAVTAEHSLRSTPPPSLPSWCRLVIRLRRALPDCLANRAAPRVGSMLDERQAAIEGDLAEAQKLRTSPTLS